jgi:hypothetical protein
MFIYNDVKISICICGDMAVMAGDLPQYVLLTMEGIGLHVPDMHVFCERTVCALALGCGVAKVRPSVGRPCSWQSLVDVCFAAVTSDQNTARAAPSVGPYGAES